MVTGLYGLVHQSLGARHVTYGDEHKVWLQLCCLFYGNDWNCSKCGRKTGIPKCLVVISKCKELELVSVDQTDKRTAKLTCTEYDKCLHRILLCQNDMFIIQYNF